MSATPDPPPAEPQAAPAVLMVRPRVFYANPQTAPSNAFQADTLAGGPALLAQALAEFDAAAEALRAAGVEVLVMDAAGGQDLPDALFPNNWLSTHADATVVLYPMLAANRRAERNALMLERLQAEFGFKVARTLDLSPLEDQGLIVEGTGSLVLDRRRRVAYACLSARSHPEAITHACEALGYQARMFSASDPRGQPVYHTNVMLAVGSQVAIACLDSLPDRAERDGLQHALEAGGAVVVGIDHGQMAALCANVLELAGADGPMLAVSTRAWRAFSTAQRRLLERHLQPVPVNIDTIEHHAGGGIRCMLAELHLPRG
ncbi:MAG: amidinotransferase [Gammaproteobacteria bacterium]|nr:MAG: amidinotransferase [Gammaproteobacteria bacterium]